jgi:uncharacterized membrane protein/Mg-chelatase subunit ChlD
MTQLLPPIPNITLDQPLLLWLFALAVPLVLLVPRQRLRSTPLLLSGAVLGLRLLIVGLGVGALAEPALRPPGRARSVVFAIDVSDSQSADQRLWSRAWVERAARALPPGSQSRTIEFAERAQLASSISGAGTPPPGTSTDIGAALRLATSLLPRDSATAPEVVLLTDGWSTAGEPLNATPPAGIALSYVVPPEPASALAAVIRHVGVAPVVRVGEPIEVTVDMQAETSTDARLRVWLDDRLTVDGSVRLEPGETRLVTGERVDSPGFVHIRAELRVEDQASTYEGMTVAKPAGRVLMLEDQQGQANDLARVLEREGLVLERRASSSVPPTAAALGEFEAVVLVNTPATSLALDQQRTLQAFVQERGGGLLVIGGPRTFSPGGYQGTVLDEILPVAAEPPIEPQQGNLALILVIDRSGSMDVVTGGVVGGATKIAMARQAAVEAAGLLQPGDTLGVVAFDSAFQWVVQPTKLNGNDDIRRAQAQISTIRPGGGTSIFAPLEAAYEAVSQIDAPLRHVVLLTDGESSDRGYEALIERMRPSQITLSTLAVGSDADTRLLSGLARLGGGRYYFTERSAQIPRIASKETTILTRNAVMEGRVGAVVGEPSPLLRSLSGEFPALGGYIATTRKDRAVTALETERGHPLLAHWQYGLGRVVVWTSQAQQGWSADWASWAEAGRYWSQVVRWMLPSPMASDFMPAAQVDPDGRRVTLEVRALSQDGRFADLQDTRATVLAPDGTAREVVLPQVAPGTYRLETRVDAPGSYRVLFKQGTREDVAGFTAVDAVESHFVGANRDLLDQLARDTAGREYRDPAEFARPGNGAGPAVPLWPWLLGLALALLPVDVYLRRRA